MTTPTMLDRHQSDSDVITLRDASSTRSFCVATSRAYILQYCHRPRSWAEQHICSGWWRTR